MAFRAVSLDLFDTLVDLTDVEEAVRASTRALHAAVCECADVASDDFLAALRAVDRELRKSRYAEGREVSSEERFGVLAAQLGIGDAQLPERLTRLHMGAIRSGVRVPEHHGEVLRALGERVRLGVCSNFTHAQTARAILAEAELLPRLDAVVISVEVGVRKPRREIFEAVLSGLEAEPGETLHVGDSLRADVGGAAALGVASAWITRQVADPQAALAAHDGPPPDFIVSDLRDLAALLDAPHPREQRAG